MKNTTTPTYAEFAAELTRRLCALKFDGEFSLAQQAGVFRCLSEIIRYQQEIARGIYARMLAAVEEMEQEDDQPTEDEVADSDLEDWQSFRRECGYRNI
jgi:uncharacterized protein YecA (UPF0149 family)